MARESCESRGKLLSPLVTNLPCLVVIDHAEEEILSFWFVTRSHMTTWSEGWVPLVISHHPVKVGGPRRCAKEDIWFLVCQVISRVHVVRESRDIVSEFSPSQVTTLQSLVIIGLVEEGILSFQFVMWSQLTRWSEDYVISWVSFPHCKSPPC